MALKYVLAGLHDRNPRQCLINIEIPSGALWQLYEYLNYKTINVGLDLNLNKLNGDCGFYCRAHSVQKLNQLNWRRREIHQDKDLDKMLYLYLYSKYLDIWTFLSVF